MNRTLRLLKAPPYAIPTRPPPSSLPTNLRLTSFQLPARPAPSLSASNQSILIRSLRTSARNLKEDEVKHPGAKGPETGPKPAQHDNREDQNKTSSARSELRTATKDFAKIISGGSVEAAAAGAREQSSHSHGGNVKDDFFSLTRSMITSVPRPILNVGLAGTIPYLGTSLATVILAREASYASVGPAPSGYSLQEILTALHSVEHIQITYGAIILSFLGALHWGMEFAKLGGEQGYRRLMIGIVPVLFAWPTTFLSHGVALATQWFGFTGMWFLDQRASQQGWTTSWYSTYRFYLSIIVGFSIIGTLAGTGYYGAGAGADVDAQSSRSQHTTERQSGLKRLDRVKEKNFPPGAEKKTGKITGSTTGDIAVEEDGDGEAFLKFRNIEKEEEKKREEEEEQKKKAEEQDKKDKQQKDKAPGEMKGEPKERKGDVQDKKGAGAKDDKEGGDEDKGDEKSEDDEKKGDEKPKDDKQADDKKDDKKADEKKGEEKKEDEKPEGDDKKEDEKGDDKNDDKPQEGKGKNDAKQQEAEEKKGAAGDKNTGMK